MTTTTNNKNNQVNAVVKKINAEGVSLGAVIRNFVEVAKADDFADLMLDTITGTNNAKVVLTINDIRKKLIIAYPYTDNGVMLQKSGDLWKPMTKYSGDIIKKAYYSVIGETKVAEFVPATEEQIQKAEEEKKAADEKKAAEKKEKADNQKMMAELWQEVMTAKNAEHGWEIINKYRTMAAEKAQANK